MSFTYLDETYEFSAGEIIFPGSGRSSLWVEIRWKSGTGRSFTFTIEQFPGSTEAEVMGRHEFTCANDCDCGWDGRFCIGTYDGIHANLYNGYVEIIRNNGAVIVKAAGSIADSMSDVSKSDGERLEFEEVVQVRGVV